MGNHDKWFINWLYGIHDDSSLYVKEFGGLVPDGYNFGGKANEVDFEIYNPWSILNYFKSRDKEFRTYWANTSGNDLLYKLLSNAKYDIKKAFTSIIANPSKPFNVIID